MTRILVGDARERLRELPDESVHCAVTSPPYWGLRAYHGDAGMIGLEPTLDEHLANLVNVFRAVRRVLRRDGTLWLNYGDGYVTGGGRAAAAKLKPKDLMLLPARVALALQADGWWVRSEVVWHKPSAMPESVTDRPTCAHEKVYLLSTSAIYYYDAEAVRVPRDPDHPSLRFPDRCGHPRRSQDDSGLRDSNRRAAMEKQPTANLRNVWSIASSPYRGAHFATFPPGLPEPCIRAGCPVGGVVLDPFAGAGTVGLVAERLQRNTVLVEISAEYATMAATRIRDDAPLLADVQVLDSARTIESTAACGRAPHRGGGTARRLVRMSRHARRH